MKRFHLFEWEDQAWLPAVLRDYVTDHLRYGYSLDDEGRREMNMTVALRLREAMVRLGTRRIVDLCSGAGGLWLKVQKNLAQDLSFPVEVVLTDLYPNANAFGDIHRQSGGAISYRSEPVDALDVPADLSGIRTMFTALHHFRPPQARGILEDAVRKGSGIAVFEPLSRSPRMALGYGVAGIARGWRNTPKLGRVSAQRFLLTYVLPLAPLVLAWDGIVSVLRTYTPEELRGLVRGLGGESYEWQIGRFDVPGPTGPWPITYLIGLPVSTLETRSNTTEKPNDPR